MRVVNREFILNRLLAATSQALGIEHPLRSLDRLVENEQEYIAKLEKKPADYQAQANRPFEHEAKLKELLVRQVQLNAAIDLDKNEKHVAPDDKDDGPEQPQTFVEAMTRERAALQR